MSLVNITVKGWALTFLMKGFGLSKKPSIKDGFAFPSKGLKSKNLGFRMKKVYAHFRFGLSIFTTHLTYICLKYPCHIENQNNSVGIVKLELR